MLSSCLQILFSSLLFLDSALGSGFSQTKRHGLNNTTELPPPTLFGKYMILNISPYSLIMTDWERLWLLEIQKPIWWCVVIATKWYCRFIYVNERYIFQLCLLRTKIVDKVNRVEYNSYHTNTHNMQLQPSNKMLSHELCKRETLSNFQLSDTLWQLNLF